MDTHGKLGPLFRAIGEAGEPCLARAEGTARRCLEDVLIHGIFPVIGYAGHTRAACTLLKVVPKAHLELQAMLIDVQQYKPTWAIGGTSATPKELDFPSSTTGKWEDEPDNQVDLDTMHCTESALGKVSLPPKARFVLGKVVHV